MAAADRSRSERIAAEFGWTFGTPHWRECLDHLLIVGRRHLEYALKEFVEHYQEAGTHQGLDQRTPSGQPAVTPLAGRVVRQNRLGGLIHEYDRTAA